MFNKAELARALHFGDDIEGFETWSDSEELRGLGIYEQVPEELEQHLRDAAAAAQDVELDL